MGDARCNIDGWCIFMIVRLIELQTRNKTIDGTRALFLRGMGDTKKGKL